MLHRKSIKLIHEGKYAAEVPIELHDSEHPWSPTISAADVRKLDAVRLALRSGGAQASLLSLRQDDGGGVI